MNVLKSSFLVLLCISQFAFASETYVVGVVPQFEARKIHKIWRPILEELSQNAGATFELEGSPTIPEFEKKLLEGKFDFAYMNPFHLVLSNEKQGYLPLVRDKSKKLSGILVVSKKSGITSPKELDGKELAFPAPNALGAALQMRQELTDIFGISFRPKYVETHDSVYLNVILGKASAGGGVGKTLMKQKPTIRDNLQVIHKTKSVSPHPLAAHPRVGDSMSKKVADVLLNLGMSDRGKAILANIPMSDIGEANLSDYQELKVMKLERFYVAPQ